MASNKIELARKKIDSANREIDLANEEIISAGRELEISNENTRLRDIRKRDFSGQFDIPTGTDDSYGITYYLIGGVLVLALGVGGYFLFQEVKKRYEEEIGATVASGAQAKKDEAAKDDDIEEGVSYKFVGGKLYVNGKEIKKENYRYAGGLLHIDGYHYNNDVLTRDLTDEEVNEYKKIKKEFNLDEEDKPATAPPKSQSARDATPTPIPPKKQVIIPPARNNPQAEVDYLLSTSLAKGLKANQIVYDYPLTVNTGKLKGTIIDNNPETSQFQSNKDMMNAKYQRLLNDYSTSPKRPPSGRIGDEGEILPKTNGADILFPNTRATFSPEEIDARIISENQVI
jgi:hypothetical protein